MRWRKQKGGGTVAALIQVKDAMSEQATVAFIHRYPVKGLSAEPLEETTLDRGGFIPGDRIYAIENGPSGYTPADPGYQPKIKFLELMRNPTLSAYQTTFDHNTHVLSVSRDGREIVKGSLMSDAGRDAIEAAFTAILAEEARGTLKVLPATQEFRFVDSIRSGFVSILNLGTVRAIAGMIGRDALDPLRFRMNLGIEGLAPWEEFDLVGKQVNVGGTRLQVLKRTERCAAVDVSPGHGLRDTNLNRALQERFQHNDCGVYAKVVEGGSIRLGDTFQPVQQALL